MAVRDIHPAVWDWLQTCPYIADIFFNHTQTDIGDTSMIPSDELDTEFVDGSQLRHYNVTLSRVAPVSYEPNDAANVQRLEDFEQLAEWIEAQAEARNFPKFPLDCPIDDMRVLPNASGYMVAQDMRAAKYQLTLQIDYIKERDYNG